MFPRKNEDTGRTFYLRKLVRSCARAGQWRQKIEEAERLPSDLVGCPHIRAQKTNIQDIRENVQRVNSRRIKESIWFSFCATRYPRMKEKRKG